MKAARYMILTAIILAAVSCRPDDVVLLSESEGVEGLVPDAAANPYGFYLLNEGNMGSNKATIDVMDYRTAVYSRNIYGERNPSVVKELGDVGNDIKIYRGRIYAVINASHKVEVMNAGDCTRIGQVDIPNCRYITFDGDNAYVTSYVAPIGISPYAEEGAVYRFDTATLAVTGTVKVGYQPEESVISDGYLYVANSGGYRAPDYDNTVSVIRLSDFKQTAKYPVAINLSQIRKDGYGKLWVLSRGDYYTHPSLLYRLTVNGGEITDVEDTGIQASGFTIEGDRLYLYSSPWNNNAQTGNTEYKTVDTRTASVIDDAFIRDGTQTAIKVPYGIFVNPSTGSILICDAKNYVSSGTITSYTPQGIKEWSVYTGDIPAHVAFTYK